MTARPHESAPTLATVAAEAGVSRQTVSNALKGPPIRIRIPRQDSEGISNMQIFCFDLMMFQTCLRRGIGPGFLIHDSHLFDGVDVRQVRGGLDYVASLNGAAVPQYITMMNTDFAATLTRSGFPIADFAIEPRLSDQPTGGIFGRPFGSEESTPIRRPRAR